MCSRYQLPIAMRRRKPSTHAYDYARGDGWILTTIDGREGFGRNDLADLVLYYTDEERIETHQTRNVDTTLSQLLDIGAQLGSYPGASPKADIEFSDQPRAVRMQRHATDIYRATKNARGMSPTIAIRAAEEFGSAWREKGAADWMDRVKMVGSGRAARIVAALE